MPRVYYLFYIQNLLLLGLGAIRDTNDQTPVASMQTKYRGSKTGSKTLDCFKN